jgi:hypothetical protein
VEALDSPSSPNCARSAHHGLPARHRRPAQIDHSPCGDAVERSCGPVSELIHQPCRFSDVKSRHRSPADGLTHPPAGVTSYRAKMKRLARETPSPLSLSLVHFFSCMTTLNAHFGLCIVRSSRGSCDRARWRGFGCLQALGEGIPIRVYRAVRTLRRCLRRKHHGR